MLVVAAIASYLAVHGPSASAAAQAHGYDRAFWWTCGIAAGGAVATALLLRSGPLVGRAVAPSRTAEAPLEVAPIGTKT